MRRRSTGLSRGEGLCEALEHRQLCGSTATETRLCAMALGHGEQLLTVGVSFPNLLLGLRPREEPRLSDSNCTVCLISRVLMGAIHGAPVRLFLAESPGHDLESASCQDLLVVVEVVGIVIAEPDPLER